MADIGTFTEPKNSTLVTMGKRNSTLVTMGTMTF